MLIPRLPAPRLYIRYGTPHAPNRIPLYSDGQWRGHDGGACEMLLRNQTQPGPTSVQRLQPLRWTTYPPLSKRREVANSSLFLIISDIDPNRALSMRPLIKIQRGPFSGWR